MPKLLIVDDELGSRESLRLIFSPDYTVLLAANAQEAQECLSQEPVDLVLLDLILPGQSGIEVLRQIQAASPRLPVIMVSASASIPPVVEAIRLGALDFVSKPFDVESLRHRVRRALETNRLHRQVEVLATEVSRAFPTQAVVGRNPGFLAALEQLSKAAATDTTVLIQGESGTGKELAARRLHAESGRRQEPFVAVHCAALSENLMESELFGHEKGAFTSADRQKPGRFDLAGSGTLFFDEVAEMSLATQVKLLRVVQEREFMRVGGTRIVRTNARIVSATARNLRREVAEGRFRDDLFYRLGVLPVRLPPLRERRDDVPLLVEHFLAELGPALHALTRRLDRDALQRLCAYDWPGNVRELRNVIERALVLHGREPVLRAEFLPEEFQASEGTDANLNAGPGGTLDTAVADCERRLIVAALSQAHGVQTRAAEILGTTRRILKYKMEKLGLAAAEAPPPAFP